MRLSEKALAAINNQEMRLMIALKLGVGENTVRLYIRDNEPDGDLTKASVLQIIEEETKLTQEEILTSEEKAA
jgi:hypothetical protein